MFVETNEKRKSRHICDGSFQNLAINYLTTNFLVTEESLDLITTE